MMASILAFVLGVTSDCETLSEELMLRRGGFGVPDRQRMI